MRRVLVVAAAFAAACNRAPKAPQIPPEPPQVRITQFYAPPVVPRGEKATLCYGVENATKVRLDPPVERLWPSFVRCFPVDPARASKYTLTAEDAQGRSVSQTIEMRIGPPRPRIIEVSINKTRVKAGEEVILCYKAVNALSVDAGPGRYVTTRSNDHACLSDRPKKSTTYHVRIAGAPGSEPDSEQVTVSVTP